MKRGNSLALAIIFGALAIILLPVTCLWAVFAYLAGDRFPMLALRGKNFDGALDSEETI